MDVAISAVAGELLEKLGSGGAPLAEGLLLRLGEMCAGASDAAEEGADEASDKVSLAAQNALGQGIRSMGPSPVLAVLPLGLVEVLCSHLALAYTLSCSHIQRPFQSHSCRHLLTLTPTHTHAHISSHMHLLTLMPTRMLTHALSFISAWVAALDFILCTI